MDSGKAVGAEYGLSKVSVIRLIRIDKLIDELKALVDSVDIAIRTGVELSFLSAETQAEVPEQAEDFKIDMKKAKSLPEAADGEGNIDHDTMIRIITGAIEVRQKPKSVKISNDTYRKYFGVETKAKEISETIEKALAFYFANISEDE